MHPKRRPRQVNPTIKSPLRVSITAPPPPTMQWESQVDAAYAARDVNGIFTPTLPQSLGYSKSAATLLSDDGVTGPLSTFPTSASSAPVLPLTAPAAPWRGPSSFGDAKAQALAARVDPDSLEYQLSRQRASLRVTPFKAGPLYAEEIAGTPAASVLRLSTAGPIPSPAIRAKQRAAFAKTTSSTPMTRTTATAPSPTVTMLRDRVVAAFNDALDEDPEGFSPTREFIVRLTKAWHAAHKSAARADERPEAEPNMENAKLAELLGDWIIGMEDSNEHFNSVAVFLEKKLTQLEAMVAYHDHPNRVRTAIVFALLSALLARTGLNEGALIAIRYDLLQACYTGESLRKSGLDMLSYHPQPRTLTVAQTIHKLLECTSFADVTEQTQQALEDYKRQAAAELKTATVRAHALCAVSWMSKCRELMLLRKVFSGWQHLRLLKQTRKEMELQFKKKLQTMAIMKQKAPERFSLPNVVTAWRLFVLMNKHENLNERLTASEKEVKTLQEKLHAANQAHEETKHALRDALSQSRAATVDLEHLQQQSQKQLLELRKIIVSASGALEVMGQSTLSLMGTAMEQIARNPDAGALEKMLSKKEKAAWREGGAQSMRYLYSGDGTGEDDGTDLYGDIAVTHSDRKHGDVGPVGSIGSGGGTISTLSTRSKAVGGSTADTVEEALEYERDDRSLAGPGADENRSVASAGEGGELIDLADEDDGVPIEEEALTIMSHGGSNAPEAEAAWHQAMVTSQDRLEQQARKRQALFLEHYQDRQAGIAAIRAEPIDASLMTWVNYQLKFVNLDGDPFLKRVHNFGSDFADAEVLAALLFKINPTDATFRAATCQDPTRRVELVVSQLNSISPPAGQFLSVDQLGDGDQMLISALIARLFCTHPGLKPADVLMSTLQSKLRATVDAWKAVGAALADAGFVGAPWKTLTAPNTPVGAVAPELNVPSLVSRLSTRGLVNMDASALSGKFLRLTLALSSTADAIRMTYALSCEGRRLWEDMVQASIGHVWKMFESKLLAVPEPIVDIREARELEEYTVLLPLRYRDLLDKYCKNQAHAEQEIEAMQAVLREYRAPLSKIFQYYCASGDGSSISTMTSSEYWQLMKDCKLVTGGYGDKKAARLDLIFIKVNQKAGLPDDCQKTPDGELMPRQFIECLVRIAVLMHEGTKNLSLSTCLRAALENNVIPFSVQSNTEEFRTEVSSRDVRAVFKRHRAALQRIFAFYSNQKTGTMSDNDFFNMLKDCQLIDSHITQLQVKHIFAHTQLEEAFLEGAESGGGEDAMVYSEFLEGLAATSMFKLCSPYVCMAKRVESFITDYLLPKAKQRVQKKQRRSIQGGLGMESTAASSPRSVAGSVVL